YSWPYVSRARYGRRRTAIARLSDLSFWRAAKIYRGARAPALARAPYFVSGHAGSARSLDAIHGHRIEASGISSRRGKIRARVLRRNGHLYDQSLGTGRTAVMGSFTGKTAVVTGASRGIGRAIAIRLA